MKKILFLAILTFSIAFVQAQQMSPAGGSSSNGVTPAYLTTSPTLAYKCASFQFNVTRVSAACNGQILMYGSNDGTNYVQTAAADSLHISNAATQSLMFTIAPATGVLYKYYRAKLTQQVADTVTVTGYFYGRQ